MVEVLLVGEPMVLLTGNEYQPLSKTNSFSTSLAGAELNVAIGLKRLNHSVAYVSQLGKDAMGDFIYEEIGKKGINCGYITRSSCSFTGLMMKNRVNKGDPEISYFRKGSAFSYLDVKKIEKIDFTNLKHIHLTGIPLALSKSVKEAIFHLIKKAKQYSIYISFDPNIRESLWASIQEMREVMNEVASQIDLFIPGVNEGKLLSGLEKKEDICQFYHAMGVKTIVMKLGAKGAYVSEQENAYKVEGYSVKEIVDTVGAGDGFAVGLISGRLEGLTLQEAVKRANAIGAIQVMTLGDNEGLPTHQALEAFMIKRQ